VLASGGALGTGEVGELVIQQADLVVLIVAEGTKIADIRKTLELFADFGVTPGWALYASEQAVRRARIRRPNDDSVMIDVRDSQTLPVG